MTYATGLSMLPPAITVMVFSMAPGARIIPKNVAPVSLANNGKRGQLIAIGR